MPQNRVPANIANAARGLSAARQTAQRLGLPLTPNDPFFRAAAPAAQNAAPLYQQIRAITEKEKSKSDLSRFLKPTRTEADRQAAKSDLRRYAAALQIAKRATSLPRCVFPRNWSDGPAMTFPEYATMRLVARLLAAQAILYREANDPVNALKSLRQGLALANHAAEQPPIIPILVSAAIMLIVNAAYQEVFLRFGTRPDLAPQWAAYQRKLTERSMLKDLERAFRGEVVFTLPSLEDYKAGRVNNPLESFGVDSVPLIPANLTPAERKPYADAWETRHWQYWNELFAEMRRPGCTLRSLYRKADTLTETHEASVRGSGRDYSYLFTAIITPVIAQIVRKGMQIEAVRRLSATALQAVNIKQKTGQYPAALPNPPLDPFTDQPLIYRQIGGKRLVYSRSINGRDDNGNTNNGTDKELEGFPLDIAFRLP